MATTTFLEVINKRLEEIEQERTLLDELAHVLERQKALELQISRLRFPHAAAPELGTRSETAPASVASIAARGDTAVKSEEAAQAPATALNRSLRDLFK